MLQLGFFGGFFSKYFYMAVCMCVFWGKGHGFGMLCQEGRVTKKRRVLVGGGYG